MMNLRGLIPLTVALVSFPLGPVPSDAELDAAVRTAYPAKLAAEEDDHRKFFDGSLPDRRSAFAVLERKGETATVFAVHSDGTAGTAQILTIGPAGTRVVAAFPDLFATGPGEPRVELDDLDGDAAPEVLAVFPDHRVSELTYVFQTKGGRLTLISPTMCPTEGQYVHTDLLYPMTIDLDGDKVLELIDYRDGRRIDELSEEGAEAVIGVNRVLELRDGRYERLFEAVFFDSFRRSAGQPETADSGFFADAGPADLFLVNGVPTTGRVSSATVTLNGTEVLSEKNFNQNATMVTVGVNLKQENDLTVRLAGKPESGVVVYIVPRAGKPAEACH